MSKLSERVAGQLKAVRIQKGLSQADVAKRAGVERSYISSLETGKNNFSLNILEKVLGALGIRGDDIAFEIRSGDLISARLPFVEGLFDRMLPSWEGKQWYHQRFDGCPYLLHMIAEAEVFTDRENARKDGLSFSAHFCFFDDGKADWYIAQDDIDRIARLLTERAMKDPTYVETLMKEWDADEKRFYAACAQIAETDLRALSDQELIALHDAFVDTAVRRNSSSSIIDGFALGTDTLLEGNLKSAYAASALKSVVPFSEVFAALTAPLKKSFLAEAEKELYETVVAINADPERKDGLIRAYRDRFFWIRNNYVDSLDLPVHYFEDEVARIRSSGVNPARQAKEIDAQIAHMQEKKAEYAGQLALDAETSALARTTELFTHWQDDRKKSTFFATHHFFLLLSEISARARVPLDLLKYLSPREVAGAYANGPDALALKARSARSAFYWDAAGHDAVAGGKAERAKLAVLGDQNVEALNDFRGISASLGKAIGRVKVVSSAKEIGKVEKGDILVAVMTRPDYVPAMRKAAAIVTDEGGITSHAAIVSRELKIPCVIGTKIATRVLKDGDEVEVNANHGVVRKIHPA